MAIGYTVEQFSGECRRILKADPGPEGRQKICALVREVCKDEAFVAANLGDDIPNCKVLYEDPELGFCFLGHVHRDAPGQLSPLQDHGPSWAIYGQAKGRAAQLTGELHQRLIAARQQGNGSVLNSSVK